MPPLTPDELKARLEALAKASPPEPNPPAAMCYRMAGTPQTADYVCPADGARTQYLRDSGLVDFVDALPSMRMEARSLPGLDASLDEKSMCHRCTPKAPTRSVALVIRHADGRTVRTEGVVSLDLQLLREFLGRGLEHAGSHGSTSPLKAHLPRIRALLGLP